MIVREVTNAVFSIRRRFIQFPGTRHARAIAKGFSDIAEGKFPPLIVGICDGTHCAISAPQRDDSPY